MTLSTDLASVGLGAPTTPVVAGGYVQASSSPAVDTSQPSPKTVTINPPNAPTTVPASAGTSALVPTPTQNEAALAPKSAYQQGFDNAKANGEVTPATTAEGASTVQQYAPATYDGNGVDLTTQASAAHQKVLDDYAATQSSQGQQQTLVQQYNDLESEYGISGINAQLVDMQTVMNGTQDDIAKEISASGGMATASQVLALTTARNKTILQNYNTLLQTRDNLQNNITTMMGLSEQDRTYASAQSDKQLNFDEAQQTYADTMLKNSQDNLKSMAQSIGWDNVLKSAQASGDPNAIATINETMGSGFDLATTAAQAASDRAEADAKTQLDQQAQRENIIHSQNQDTISAEDLKIKEATFNAEYGGFTDSNGNTITNSSGSPITPTQVSGVKQLSPGVYYFDSTGQTKGTVNAAKQMGIQSIDPGSLATVNTLQKSISAIDSAQQAWSAIQTAQTIPERSKAISTYDTLKNSMGTDGKLLPGTGFLGIRAPGSVTENRNADSQFNAARQSMYGQLQTYIPSAEFPPNGGQTYPDMQSLVSVHPTIKKNDGTTEQTNEFAAKLAEQNPNWSNDKVLQAVNIAIYANQ